MKFSTAILTTMLAHLVASDDSMMMNSNSTNTKFQANSAVICGLSPDRAVSCSPRMIVQESTTPTTTTTTYQTVPFPHMPPKIHALIHKDWNVLDPKGEEMMVSLKNIDAAVEFAHARSTFYEHLQGTFGILAAWNQPEVVRRTGLVHTAYSGDLFQFYLFDANLEEERDDLCSILGTPAEALTYLFGTVNRGGLCDFGSVFSSSSSDEESSAA
jgi:hypothetical protein